MKEALGCSYRWQWSGFYSSSGIGESDRFPPLDKSSKGKEVQCVTPTDPDMGTLHVSIDRSTSLIKQTNKEHMQTSMSACWNGATHFHHDNYENELIRPQLNRGSFSTEAKTKTDFNKNTAWTCASWLLFNIHTDILSRQFIYIDGKIVQTEIHNLHGKCIGGCGYLDKHTRLKFYL